MYFEGGTKISKTPKKEYEYTVRNLKLEFREELPVNVNLQVRSKWYLNHEIT